MKPVDGKICSLNTRTSTEHSDSWVENKPFLLQDYISVFLCHSPEWSCGLGWIRSCVSHTVHGFAPFSFLFLISATTADFLSLSLSLSSVAGVQPHKYSCRNLPVSASTVWSHGVRGRCVKGRPSSPEAFILFCVLCKSPVVVDQSHITYQYFHLPSASSLLSFHRSNSQFSLFLCLSPG